MWVMKYVLERKLIHSVAVIVSISKHVSNPIYVITQNLRTTNVRNLMGMKLL